MSEAALVSKDIHFPEVEFTLPTPPPEAKVNFVSEIERRKTAHQELRLEAVAPQRDRRDLLWTITISCVAVIVVIGLTIGYLIPGPATGVILPIGLVLWWLLYKLADRFGQLV
jgi:hypothetical protein